MQLMNSFPPPPFRPLPGYKSPYRTGQFSLFYRLSRQLLQRGLSMFSHVFWNLCRSHRKSGRGARAGFSFVRACLYACALLLPALAAAPASAQLVLQLDLSPDRVNAGGSVSAVLCPTQLSGSCPARGVGGYGIDATFRLRGESDRGGEVFSEEITITAEQSSSTRAVSLGPLPAGIWSFSLANVDETPLGNSIMLSAPPQLISFAPVTQVQLEVLQPEVAAGEAVRLRLVPDGIYDRARAFVVRGSNNFGAEAFLPVVEISADEGVVERSFTSLPPGLWTFFLTENLVGANTQIISVLREVQVRVGFPAIIVEGPAAPGVFASDGISYASLSDSVVLRVSTSTPPRRQVTLMLQGESSSGEFTDVQPVTLDTGGSPGTVSFSIPGEGLWTFGIVQQDPADTAYPAAPSALALVRVGPPPLRLSGYDSGGSGQDVQLRLSSPLAVTGEFMVEGVKGDSSMRNLVSFTQELQKDINFGRLDGGRWSFRVIDSSPAGIADLSRAEREVLIEGDMRYATRFQPEHANAVRYDSIRNRFFALAGTRATAQWFTPNGSPGSGDGFCISGLSVRILRASSIIATNFIGNRPSAFSFGRQTCPGDNDMADLDVTFAAEGGGAVRYRFDTVNVLGEGGSQLQNPREVYAEPLPSAESFSPGQNVIEVTETAVLNLQLREPALVDSRFTVRAQDLSAAGSSARFNTIALLRGESSASVSFRNMERGVWSFTLVQVNPPQLQTPQLLATVPARVAAGSIFVRIEAPARVAGGEVVLRLVPDISLQVDATFTVTATGMTAGGLMLASMMQQVHLPAGMPSAEATFSGLSPGSWVFGITGVEPENPRLDLSSTAAVTTGDLRAQLRVADSDRRVQAGRDVVLLLELPQSLDDDATLTVRAEGPGGMSRVASVTLRSGVSAASAVFSGLEPGRWQFTVSASVEAIDTEGVMVTLDVVSRSALGLRVQGARNLADVGSVLPSALPVQLRITATPAAIDDAALTLRAVSGITSQMITVTLLADTATVTADFGMLPDGVWRFSVAETVPDDLFDAAAEVEVEIRRPRGVLSAGRTIARGSSNLPLTVAFNFPAGSAASDNFVNRLIAISPAGVETSRTDSFGAVPSSMVYSFGSDASADDHAFAGVVRTDGIWTFRHECSAARVICGEAGVLRVRVGDPPDASLSSVSSQILAGRPVPISLRLTGETVGDLRLTVLAQKSGTEESTSAVIVLPGDQSVLDFNFPSLSAGTWVFGLSTQTEHINPRADDADGAATELVRRDSLATARTTAEVVRASSFLVSLVRPEQETVLTGALLLGREVLLRIDVTPPPLEELEVVLSGSSGMAEIAPQTVILSPAPPSVSVRVQPSVAGDWLFSIAVDVPSDGVAAGQVNPAASSVLLTVAPPSAARLTAPRFSALNQNIPLRLELERGLSTQQATFDIGVSVDGVASTTLTLTVPSVTMSVESEVLLDALGEWVFTVTAVRGVSPARAVVFADASATVTVTDIPRATLQVLPPSPVLTGVPVDLRLSLSLPLLSSVSLTVRASHDGAAPTRTWTVELTAQQQEDEAYADIAVFPEPLTDLEAGLWTFRVDADDALGPPLNEPQVEVRLPRVMLELAATGPVMPGEPVRLLLLAEQAPGGSGARIDVSGSAAGRSTATLTVLLPAESSTAVLEFPELRPGTWTFTIIAVTDPDTDAPSQRLLPGSPREAEAVVLAPQVSLQALHPEVNGLPEVRAGETVELELAVTESTVRPALVFTLSGSGVRFSGERGVMVPGGIAPVSLAATQSTARVSIPGLATGTWEFAVDASSPSGEVNLNNARTSVRVRLLELRFEADTLQQSVGEGSPVVLTVAAESALPEEIVFGVQGTLEGSGEMTPSLSVTIGAGETTGEVTFTDLAAGIWVFSLADENFAGVAQPAGDDARVTVVPLPLASLGAEPLETVRGAAVTLTLGVTAAPMQDTEFSIIGSIEDTVQTQPPLALTLPAGMNTATLSYSPQEPGEWIFQVTAAVPENTVDISAAQTAPVIVQLPSLRAAALQSTAAQGAAVQVGIETDLPLLSTVMVTVQALRRGAPPLVREMMVLLQIQERAGSAGEAQFGPGVLLSGDWDITLTAVQPAGRAEVDSGASAAVAVAAPQLRLSAVQPSVPIGTAVQLRVRAEGADGMDAAPDTAVTVTVEGVCSCSGTTTTLAQAITLSAAAASGEVEFAGDELRLGEWNFEASAVPAGFLDLSGTQQVMVNVMPEPLPATLAVSPSAPATAVRGELVVLSVEVTSTSTMELGSFSARVVAVPPVGSTQHLSVPVAAGQSIGTQSFVPARSGPWQFTLDSEVAAESSGLLLDNRSGTLTLMVEDAQLDVSAPPGIDADDLVLALRYLELCLTPAQGCPDIEDSLRLNLGQGAGPILLTSLRLPEVAGDGVDRGQADIVMLLDYLSGIRGDTLFPPGAPSEFREVRLEIIEELLGGSP